MLYYSRMKKLVLIFFFLVVVIGVTVGYFYKNNVSYKNPESNTNTEARALAQRVGMLMVLPEDEVPTIATVSNPKALQNQAFFTDAKVGDKVLIYYNAQKAILYDPVANKIINVVSVDFGNDKKIFQPRDANMLNVETEKNTF